jgi:general secretion pathway protein G
MHEGDFTMKNKKKFKALRGQDGITLIELIVVMAILALIGSLVVPNVFKQLSPAKRKTAYTQIELLGTALDSFRLDIGRYPTTSEGLEALLSAPSGADNWNGPYLKKSEIPNDPWGEPYPYQAPGSHGDYDLYSYGADKSEGGEDENKDVVSWKGLD